MLSVSGVELTFSPGTPLENRVLQSVDLSIEGGQFVTVIGSNGAGKSTLLNVVAGELRPDQGRIRIGAEDVTNWSTERRSRLVGRVFQDPKIGTCENLTIEENLSLSSRRAGRRRLYRAISRRYRNEWRERLAELGLGLENRLEDPIGLLSGGQRQALSLLMACLVPMEALLLDEHIAALDPRAATSVMALTDSLVERNRLTVMMVTHSMRHALDHGHRTIMLHEGRVVFDVSGAERSSYDVSDLLRLFEDLRGEKLDDDSLILG